MFFIIRCHITFDKQKTPLGSQEVSLSGSSKRDSVYTFFFPKCFVYVHSSSIVYGSSSRRLNLGFEKPPAADERRCVRARMMKKLAQISDNFRLEDESGFCLVFVLRFASTASASFPPLVPWRAPVASCIDECISSFSRQNCCYSARPSKKTSDKKG